MNLILYSHSTLPIISWLSSPSRFGTGTPHVRSRVTGLGLIPAFRRASTRTPSPLMTALGDHSPSLADFLIHSSVRSWTASSLTYIWAELRRVTVCDLSTRQRGLMSSIASSVREHRSHWSPRASFRGVSKSKDEAIQGSAYICTTVRAGTLYESICKKSEQVQL